MALIKELPEVERPREKMRHFGAVRLSNAELLAILLGSGTKTISATALAEKILARPPGGLAFLTDCAIEELFEIPGIGEAKSCQILAAVELGKRIATKPRSRKVRIGSPEDIAKLFMEDMRHLKRESFKILMLNIKNEIITIEEISIGNINSSIVDPREVFRPAIKRSAASIMLVHNHPSGNPKPSIADIQITDRLCQAGELLGIKVLDHIVIGDGNYVSFKRENLI